jgi:hypothetical protein
MYSKNQKQNIKEDNKREARIPDKPSGEAFIDKMKEGADDEYDGGHFLS